MIIAICIVKLTRSQNPAPNHSAACIGELPMATLAANTMPTATSASANASGNQSSNHADSRSPAEASHVPPDRSCATIGMRMISKARLGIIHPMAHGGKFVLPLLILALGVAAAAQLRQVRTPDPDIGVDTLNARAKAQRATLDQFKVFYDFQFADRVKESGITFVHRIVDDAGRDYKPVHYDHGNGVAVADVDGDGLLDIYFTNQIGGNQLWKNLGGGKFRNITREAGVALADRIGVTASFADIDNDGDQDLFVTTVRGGNVLFENDGQGHFKNISKAAGVDYVGHSSGAVFFDFDNDGLLDLYLCNVGHYTIDRQGRGGAFVGMSDGFSGHLHPDRSETAILYKNLGRNRFKDVTQALGLGDAGWSGDASVADLNGDGFPDLYALNMQGANHYFENQRGRSFVDKTAQMFPRTSWGAMGIKF